ncbi:MAG: peptide/nickel transport system ATP-binding protein [Gammaproteobacteria bacterium]|jgi:peptide/nickel transport system ATP-binding protein
MTSPDSRSPLLDINGLSIHFGSSESPSVVVDNTSFTINRGETVVLVGESGSGKSISALAIMRLLPHAARIAAGSILLDGKNILSVPEKEMGSIRGARIGMIFQEPQSSLNPVITIGNQIGEVLRRHKGLRGKAEKDRVIELLEAVEIPDAQRRYAEFPHQFSGGMKQRVMIAIAMAAEPDLIIADEPTTALDVTVQAQVLELLRKQQRETEMGILFITHDLGVAYQMADRLLVMKQGSIVEEGAREAFYAAPKHAYSKQLFDALPSREKRIREGIDRTIVSPKPVLEIENLKVHYPIRKGLFKRIVGHVKAVDGVSLTVNQGTTVAIVGESGSGKTTLGKGILRLLPLSGGHVRYRDVDLASLSASEMRGRRSALQVVFQDPYSSMNPRMMINDVILEGMIAQRVGKNRAVQEARVDELLMRVGLEPAHKFRYPHEFSGGQRQRICIARALAVEPDVIVCDEPTSALDVSVQAQILDLLRELQDSMGLTYLFITHNLSVVAYLAHYVAVMYKGEIVEQGPVDQILDAPQHPYTQQLLAAIPRIDGSRAA